MQYKRSHKFLMRLWILSRVVALLLLPGALPCCGSVGHTGGVRGLVTLTRPTTDLWPTTDRWLWRAAAAAAVPCPPAAVPAAVPACPGRCACAALPVPVCAGWPESSLGPPAPPCWRRLEASASSAGSASAAELLRANPTTPWGDCGCGAASGCGCGSLPRAADACCGGCWRGPAAAAAPTPTTAGSSIRGSVA